MLKVLAVVLVALTFLFAHNHFNNIITYNYEFNDLKEAIKNPDYSLDSHKKQILHDIINTNLEMITSGILLLITTMVVWFQPKFKGRISYK